MTLSAKRIRRFGSGSYEVQARRPSRSEHEAVEGRSVAQRSVLGTYTRVTHGARRAYRQGATPLDSYSKGDATFSL
jgi:hypothetical protein